MEEMSDGAEIERDHAVLRSPFRCGGGVAKKGENGLASWRAEAATTVAAASAAAAPSLSPNKMLNQGENCLG